MRVLGIFVGLALVAHLVFAFGGGRYVVPWFLSMFRQEPPPKVEEPKKEVVEVEMVEAVVALPPPPEPPPTPPEPPKEEPPPTPPPVVVQPPPPEPPKAEPPPPEPAKAPPPDPTPAPVAVANPVFADPTPAPPPPPPPPVVVPPPTPQPVVNPGPAPGPRYVKARFYQRSEIVYPYEARKRRLQGVVILEVVFAPDGKPVTVEVFQSSGQAMLDRAAKAHFIENGYAPPGEAGRVRVEVEFRLVNR
jgi:protein TonB